MTRFHELIARDRADPGQVMIGIETDRGPCVAALVAAGYRVFAINPAVARHRERHGISGAKCDAGDANPGRHGPHRPATTRAGRRGQ